MGSMSRNCRICGGSFWRPQSQQADQDLKSTEYLLQFKLLRICVGQVFCCYLFTYLGYQKHATASKFIARRLF